MEFFETLCNLVGFIVVSTICCVVTATVFVALWHLAWLL